MIGFLTLSYNSIHEFPIQLWYSWSLSWKGLPFRRSLPVWAIIFHIDSDPPPPPNSLPSHDTKWEPFFDLSSYSKAEIDYKIKTRFIIIAAIIKKKKQQQQQQQQRSNNTHQKKQESIINIKIQIFPFFAPLLFWACFTVLQHEDANRKKVSYNGQTIRKVALSYDFFC